MLDDYYTVTEYAELMKKDPSNIRRNLICGKIFGEKVGKQWLIPKSTVYPVDKRIKTNLYSGQRKKIRIKKAHPQLMSALSDMSNELRYIYGDNLSEIILYGSYARGNETSESDVDIAVFLKNPPTDNDHDKMTDIVVDYELSLGKTLSVITIEADHYIECKNILPFYINIQKEGIPLWKKA